MKNNLEQSQWFIITAIGGKEDSIAESLKEKIKNFGYDDFVKEIRVFKEEIITEDVFSRNDTEIPKSLKNTKTITWQELPNGSFKRTKKKVINKFPGYIFINMIMNSEIWYTIRNTNGVLGFVGSSGKGAMPIPISISEYDKVDNVGRLEAQETKAVSIESPQINDKKTYTTKLKVGFNVEVTTGVFSGSIGEIKSINLDNGKATVEIDFFGRAQVLDIGFDELKVA